MNKKEIALQITLKLLENFSYNVTEYSGDTVSEHAKKLSEVAATLYNGVYNQINLKDE